MTRLTIANWNDLARFVKANKGKIYVLRPVEMYGSMNKKKTPAEIKDVASVTLEVEYEDDVNE